MYATDEGQLQDLAFLSLRRALQTLYITKDKDADAVLSKDKKK